MFLKTLSFMIFLMSCNETDTVSTTEPIKKELSTPSEPPALEPPPLAEETEAQVEAQVEAPIEPPSEQKLAPEEPKIPVRVHISNCSTLQCETTLSFSHPMVQDITTADPPSAVFSPPQTGSWRWESPKKAVFTPTGGSFYWGAYVKITIQKMISASNAEMKKSKSHTLKVPDFKAGAKIAHWPVELGNPKFVGVLNWFSDSVGDGPILLLYDQPIDASKMAKTLNVLDSNSNPLAYKIVHPTDISYAIHDTVDTNHLLAIQIKDRSKVQETVLVDIPKGHQARLVVQKEFVLEDIRIYGGKVITDFNERIPNSIYMHIELNRHFHRIPFEEALTITPTPLLLESNVERGQAYLRLKFEQGETYNIEVAPFKDSLGNLLSKPVSITLKTKDKPPVMTLPQNPLTMEGERGALTVRHTNTGALTFETHEFQSPSDYVKAVRFSRKTNSCSDLKFNDIKLDSIKTESLTPKTDQNKLGETTYKIQKKSGLFCVDVRAEGVGSEAKPIKQMQIMQVGNIGITAKISEGTVFSWITNMAGTEMETATISLIDSWGNIISTKKTSKDGTVTLDAEKFANRTGLKDTIFLAVEGAQRAVIKLNEGALSKAWQFGLKGKVTSKDALHAALFTERGVYRPGETVHVTFMGGPKMFGKKVVLFINDSRGQEVRKKSVVLDSFGVASIDLPLNKAAAVGEYSIFARMDDKENKTHTFRVEEYRIPTFEVKLSSDDDWVQGATVNTLIKASYLHGGTLDGRAMKWDVSRTSIPFRPHGFNNFVFTAMERPSNKNITSGKGQLDGAGTKSISFALNMSSNIGPMRYTISANATDLDRQNYGGQLSKTVHPTDRYIGLKPPSRTILAAGTQLSVPIIAVNTKGEPLSNISIRAKLERIDNHTNTRLASDQENAQRINREVTVQSDSCLVVSKKISVDCTFEINTPGAYRVRAWALDTQGRDVQAAFEFSATGNKTAAWPRFDREQIDLITDKTSYSPGDTAKLMVKTPFAKAQGLVTIERDGVLSHQRITIDENTPAIEVPITEEHAPNVFVSVVLVRHRVHDQKDAVGFETGAPAFRIGATELRVQSKEKRLNVAVIPNQKTAFPSQSFTTAIELKDHTGKPVKGQVALMVVDEAVLGLTAFSTPDPTPQMFPPQNWGVRTADSRLNTPHSKRFRNEKIFPGGDGSDQNEPGALPNNMLRNLFKSTAYFNPKVPVDATGRAEITFEFPDNTTTYRIMAVAIDEKGHVGANDEKVTVQLPLMVQAVLPRFAYPGDKLQLEAIVHNGTDKEGNVSVQIELEGLVQTEGSSKQSTLAPANGVGSIKVPIEIMARDTALIRFKATMGKHSDNIEVSLPILNPGVKRTQVLTANVTNSQELLLRFPTDRVEGTSQLEVVASTTSLTKLKDSVQYLMGYPNGCIEQTTSRAYPLVMLKDLLPEIGVEVDQKKLEEYTTAGIQRILSFQTASGGLSYWPGSSKPHAFATAFGLTALIEGKDKGYDVPQSKLDQMADYLEETLRKGDVTESIPHGNMADGDTRALFVMTLGRLGRPQNAMLSTLWQKKEKLTPFGLSFLGIAASEINNNHPLKASILEEIRKAANTSKEEAWFEGESKGGYSMDSPLRSHASSLLAFAAGNPSDNMSGKLLNGLLNRQKNGLWGNTQENVFGIMGVHRLATQGQDGDAPTIILSHNGKNIDLDGMQAPSKRVRKQIFPDSALKMSEHKISLTNNSGIPTILTVRANYDVQLTPENRAAQQNGFDITRHYESMDGEPITNGEIPLGSLIRIRIKIVSHESLNYVAIDDKLPAGLEPLNTTLATTEKVSMGEMTEQIQRSLSFLSYREIRDHRVAFFTDSLPKGSYEFIYVARATTPGTFLRPAASAEAMYKPEFNGSTNIDEVSIK